MLLPITFFFILTGALIARMRLPGNAAELGSMSDRWLAEYRASH